MVDHLSKRSTTALLRAVSLEADELRRNPETPTRMDVLSSIREYLAELDRRWKDDLPALATATGHHFPPGSHVCAAKGCDVRREEAETFACPFEMPF